MLFIDDLFYFQNNAMQYTHLNIYYVSNTYQNQMSYCK
jgi:hypothetical protein